MSPYPATLRSLDACCVVQALIEREHEFLFAAVWPHTLDGDREPGKAIVCCRWNDEDYRRTRCPPDVFQQKFGRHGIEKVYRSDSSRSNARLQGHFYVEMTFFRAGFISDIATWLPRT